jgi:hypothetical protein
VSDHAKAVIAFCCGVLLGLLASFGSSGPEQNAVWSDLITGWNAGRASGSAEKGTSLDHAEPGPLNGTTHRQEKLTKWVVLYSQH